MFEELDPGVPEPRRKVIILFSFIYYKKELQPAIKQVINDFYFVRAIKMIKQYQSKRRVIFLHINQYLTKIRNELR